MRAWVASHFALDLEGKVIGYLRSAEGGGLSTQVLKYQQGAKSDIWMQVGRPKFDDITISCGMAMSQGFYEWIAKFFNRDVTRHTGAIIGADFNNVERTRRTFKEALISEVQIQSLDGNSKEAGYMTVKLAPEHMDYEHVTSGKKIECPPGLGQPSKLWQASNFHFTVDGFEQPFVRVQKIDAFSIKQQILEYASGHQRTAVRVPGRIEWPVLNVYVPSADVAPITEHVRSRLIAYEKPKAGGLTGSITLLGPDASTELCTISLQGVDMISTEPQKFDATADQIAQTKVQIMVESMTFKYQKDAVAS
jgi:tail tube protein gp19